MSPLTGLGLDDIGDSCLEVVGQSFMISDTDMETEDDAKNNDKEHCSGMDADTKDIRDLDVD